MGKRILIIDDEKDFVGMVKTRLEASNYEVVFALDGEEGLEKVKSEKPDLIILDIMMPKMDGYSFIRELTAREGSQSVPIIVLTGKEQLKDLFEIEGVDNYLLKPLDDEELLKRVKEQLGE